MSLLWNFISYKLGAHLYSNRSAKHRPHCHTDVDTHYGGPNCEPNREPEANQRSGVGDKGQQADDETEVEPAMLNAML